MKKIVKIILLTLLGLFIATFLALGFYILSIYSSAMKIELDEEKLTSPSLAIAIYDNDNKEIKENNTFNGSYVKFDSIPEQTKEAFISIEDKHFYSHNGVNFKRILGAMVKNLKTASFKEGASTITQQLVKNTQLSSEKTFNRKIKEIALSRKVESKFSKEEILEQYLNIIYFGNNCYGIENASNYYFSKSAHELNLQEGAVLAGIIKSPSKYSPISHYDNCLKRRNLVLSEMAKDGKISTQELLTAQNSEIELNLNTEKENKLNSFSQSAIDEAISILSMPARQIAIGGYKIYTYQNQEMQTALENAIEANPTENNHAGIVLDNARHAVVAYVGSSPYKILDAKRQPGSLIKPILVYSPALNEDIIYPSTQLLDEQTTIAGYNPKNVGEVYRGYVSAREALAKSINIPAVKVLSYVGIDKAKSYAEDMGIKFDESDDSYALALGGMTYGTNILDLAGAYSTFANEGKYSAPKFISYITDKNNKLVYVHKPEERNVLREDASYMINDMLVTCAQTGTAKKLATIDKMLASKTGTVGKKGTRLNLDAWNMTYSKAYTCGVWIGNLDNTPISCAGGNQPTEIAKSFFSQIEDESTFTKPDSIVERDIDLTELDENHRIVLANTFTPDRYKKSEMFSLFNLPTDTSSKWAKLEEPEYKSMVDGNKAILTIACKNYVSYDIYQGSLKERDKVFTITGKDGKQIINLSLPSEKEKFYIVSSYVGQNKNENVCDFELIKTPKKVEKEKWYI
jgi:penicillin-binding protein 2A